MVRPVKRKEETSTGMEIPQPVSVQEQESEAQYWKAKQKVYAKARRGDPVAIAQLESEKHTWQTPQGSHVTVSNAWRAQRRSYTYIDPQSGQSVTQTGAFGSQLGSTEPLIAVIMEIHLNFTLYNQIAPLYKGLTLKIFPSERAIRDSFLQSVYRPVVSAMTAAIYVKVPADSYRLRTILHDSITTKARIEDMNPLLVIFDSGDLKYARPMNNAPPAWLKHFGTSHQGNLSTRWSRSNPYKPVKHGQAHPLYDPGADTHWFEKITKIGRDKAEKLTNDWLVNYFTPILSQYDNTGLEFYRVMGYRSPFPIAQSLINPRRFHD